MQIVTLANGKEFLQVFRKLPLSMLKLQIEITYFFFIITLTVLTFSR